LYENKNYIGKIVDSEDEVREVEVTCMEESRKIEGKFKWPIVEDKI